MLLPQRQLLVQPSSQYELPSYGSCPPLCLQQRQQPPPLLPAVSSTTPMQAAHAFGTSLRRLSYRSPYCEHVFAHPPLGVWPDCKGVMLSEAQQAGFTDDSTAYASPSEGSAPSPRPSSQESEPCGISQTAARSSQGEEQEDPREQVVSTIKKVLGGLPASDILEILKWAAEAEASYTITDDRHPTQPQRDSPPQQQQPLESHTRDAGFTQSSKKSLEGHYPLQAQLVFSPEWWEAQSQQQSQQLRQVHQDVPLRVTLPLSATSLLWPKASYDSSCSSSSFCDSSYGVLPIGGMKSCGALLPTASHCAVGVPYEENLQQPRQEGSRLLQEERQQQYVVDSASYREARRMSPGILPSTSRKSSAYDIVTDPTAMRLPVTPYDVASPVRVARLKCSSSHAERQQQQHEPEDVLLPAQPGDRVLRPPFSCCWPSHTATPTDEQQTQRERSVESVCPSSLAEEASCCSKNCVPVALLKELLHEVDSIRLSVTAAAEFQQQIVQQQQQHLFQLEQQRHQATSTCPHCKDKDFYASAENATNCNPMPRKHHQQQHEQKQPNDLEIVPAVASFEALFNALPPCHHPYQPPNPGTFVALPTASCG
ncbi:hypothetical protein cyc_02831 [Cyclospora cayetanensis]|uniref:Uncharacterized protein n=1 Tax=Cyclospora cayetanensis TaxID=88456 RepID=A0A1D3D1X1_9EIME|nr:hypothetical protein cyc_02831 [Cyclospora cayetanensis]